MSKKKKSGGGVMGREAKEVKRKILLIGEHPDTQLFSALQQEGYEVIACESAQKAWGLVYEFRPHCIIIEFHHPSRSDISVLQECRAMAEGTPIIVTTAVPVHEAFMKALEEGATSFLSLPVKPQTIRKVLDALQPATSESSTR